MVDAWISPGTKRKCRELSVRISWSSAGNHGRKLVSLVAPSEVYAHTSAQATWQLHCLLPCAGDHAGCSPYRWWDLEQKLAIF